jgi:phosphoribosylglycinamide formyltransferase-1
MLNIAVFCSGSGSNFQAIAESIKKGYIKGAKISVMVTDKPGCFARERAGKLGIETFTAELKNFKTKEDFEKHIIEELKKRDIGLVVLAGYMRMLSSYFVKKFENKILNIHPALLPSFKGTEGIKDALEYGVKVTGPTVHFVDSQMDHGPIILQEAVTVEESDTEESLAPRIHAIEHKLYPKAIKLFAEGKLKVKSRKVIIGDED